jgi:putative membrane protein
MEQMISLKTICSSMFFSVVGLFVLWVSFWVFDKITPGNLWKEIVEEKNIALAITAGAMTLAIAQIIAAAIHG